MEGIIEAQLILEKSVNLDLENFRNKLEQYGCTDIEFLENGNELTVNFLSTIEIFAECTENISNSNYGFVIAYSYFDPSTVSPEIGEL